MQIFFLQQYICQWTSRYTY